MIAASLVCLVGIADYKIIITGLQQIRSLARQ